MNMTANALTANEQCSKEWRSSLEPILPQQIINHAKINGYDIYPYHSLGKDKIFSGYDSLVTWIIEQGTVLIDGFNGVFFDDVQQALAEEFQERGISVQWINTQSMMKGTAEVQNLVEPFLGVPKSVWGKKCTLNLTDFFDMDQLTQTQPDQGYAINIAIGVGSALLDWNAPIIYLDLPKSEIQYRMRAGSITNFGNDQIEPAAEMYKRSYFVDWVILNDHKKNILNKIAVIADAQWKDAINWALSVHLFDGFKSVSQSVFRVRPWFSAGAWGGHWMQDRIEGLNKEEVNYAWSFEMIVPENGIVFESEGKLLEVTFDTLMFNEYKSILGKHADVFETEFPIRFDFLDTFDGGRLSIQCHPTLEYIRREFGENLTQDETYYILDAKNDAEVFLGFQEDIEPEKFRAALENSQKTGEEIDVTEYVQTFTSKKHDFFLIPNGTVHSSGKDNLVLEISATPYIFTFKMYDWVQADLNGQLRPINIDHAFKNLNFDRKGDKVADELISKPVIIERGSDWDLIHLPTHKAHFYDVHRIEFDTRVSIKNNDACHILMLVEGTMITVQTANGNSSTFNYAETFVIPAAAESYTIINKGNTRAKVVKVFVKDDIALPIG